jgi:hypothetical protein
LLLLPLDKSVGFNPEKVPYAANSIAFQRGGIYKGKEQLSG